MPGTLKLEKLTTAPGSDLRQLEIQYTNAARDIDGVNAALRGEAVLAYYGVGPNSGTSPMKIGSTDTQVGTAACVFTILGVPVVKAVSNAGTTFGALGTIPASTWGVIALDVVAAGTVTFRSGAANYTTGYATEALAIAALPKRITAKANMGYVTILASASTWIAATDALAGGSSGNPATTTNYYPVTGALAATGLALGPNGVVTSAVNSSGSAWTGGKNGVMIATVLNIGSTDTDVASAAFTYNANGLNNIPKAAVTAGTAFGALGTTTAAKWALFVMLINGAGTITWMAAPSNVPGYANEAAAIADLAKISPATGLCQMGYVTVQAGAATTWVAGTDALAGGTTGDQAQTTNYYPTPGITEAAGETASLLAQQNGVILTSTAY